METTRKRTHDAATSILFSTVICFTTGFLYSLGVFTTFIEKAARPPGSLNGTWASGMALISFFCTPAMFFTGVYLSEGSDSRHAEFGASRSSRTRIIATMGSLSYALLAIAGYGVQISNAFLIQLSFIPVGCGMGLFYVEAMELLAVWVPDRPGLAIGIGQMMFGLGSIISSSIFEYLVRNYTTPNALYIAAVFLSLPTAAATPFLQWPEAGYLHTHEESQSNSLVQQSTPVSWKLLVRLSSFWMYVITLFSLQTGYGFIAYYFKIGETFGKDVSTLVTSFQAANIAGTLLRPLTGALTDVMKRREGFFSLGSKNVILLLCLGEAVSFLALTPVSWAKSYEGYAIFAGICIALFAAGSSCAPLLAREQFGAMNSSVVFGVGGSMSMGFGETGAVLMLAAMDWSSSMGDVPSAYQGYYVLSLLWSVFGFAVCLKLKAETFDSDSQRQSFESCESAQLNEVGSVEPLCSNCYTMKECSYYGCIDGALRSVKVY